MFEFDGDPYIYGKRKKIGGVKEFCPKSRCSILGAVASIAGGALGLIGASKQAGAAKDAAAQNAAISRENMDLQRELLDKQLEFTKTENDLQRAIAERILGIQLAGTTDARGNRTFFKEGEGFITELSPTSQALVDASDQNALQNVLVEARRAQRGSAQNERLRNEAAGLASQFAGQLREPSITPDSIESALRLARGGAVNRAFDDITEQVALQSTRTGNESPRLLEALADQRANALLDATGSIPLEALQSSQTLNNSKIANLMNAFTAANSAASNIGNVAVQPPTLIDALANQSAASLGKVGAAGSLFQGTKGFQPATVPQNSFVAQPGQQGQVFADAGKFVTGLGSELETLFGKNDFASQIGPDITTNRGITPPRFLGNQ